METLLILVQLVVVLAMIFIGARVGGIGLGIYGMVGVFILVFGFGLEPGAIPIDVMLIIVSVITASAALQAAGIAEEASQPYHLPGTIRHMAVQPLGRYGSYMLCTAAYHIGDSTQGEGASRTSAECGDGSGIAGVYGFASVSRHGSYPL